MDPPPAAVCSEAAIQTYRQARPVLAFPSAHRPTPNNSSRSNNPARHFSERPLRPLPSQAHNNPSPKRSSHRSSNRNNSSNSLRHSQTRNSASRSHLNLSKSVQRGIPTMQPAVDSPTTSTTTLATQPISSSSKVDDQTLSDRCTTSFGLRRFARTRIQIDSTPYLHWGSATLKRGSSHKHARRRDRERCSPTWRPDWRRWSRSIPCLTRCVLKRRRVDRRNCIIGW